VLFIFCSGDELDGITVLHCCNNHMFLLFSATSGSSFSFTRPAACLLERVACCVAWNEPILLVGETGTGKTSTVQYLADKTGHSLIVINMNQQSDSADLLGGYDYFIGV
jgi:midasin (ATPase involved in ribosome maturation)